MMTVVCRFYYPCVNNFGRYKVKVRFGGQCEYRLVEIREVDLGHYAGGRVKNPAEGYT